MEYMMSFPTDLESFKTLVKKRNFNSEKIDDYICKSVIDKVKKHNFDFSDEEIETMNAIAKIGNVCGCDDDHRMAADKKICQFSKI